MSTLLVTQEEIKKQLQALETEANRIKTEYYQLLKKRKDVFKVFDMGCNCEGNCNTSPTMVPIGGGDEHSYCHDDADKAYVKVDCINGEIEVITSAAVWWTWSEIDRNTLVAGRTWYTEIPKQDSWYDQSNRVQIIGNMGSTYNLGFTSYD